MEKEIKNVSLSFCCKEDWNSFTQVDDRTRFCGSCQHNVVDFTNASQSDLNQLISSGQRVCGRFKQSQMSESFLKLAAASLVLAAATTSINCTEPENLKPQNQIQEPAEMVTTGIVVGMPILPDSLQEGAPFLPIIVSDAGNGEKTVRYNPLVPSTGNYKKK